MGPLIIRLLTVLNNETTSSTYYHIAQTLLNNYSIIDKSSISDIATLCTVSKSTISKFARSIGFEDYYELLDLNIGKCYFAVAAYPEYRNKKFERRKKIASKYTKVAKKYFATKQEDVEIIKLEGSVELGPIVGISDAIVDIVETGSTLKANGLEVIEKISDISTRLVANKVSFKFKKDEIMNLVTKLETVTEGK